MVVINIEVKEPVPAPVPPRTFVLRLTEEEMKAVMEVANFGGRLPGGFDSPYYVDKLADVNETFNSIWGMCPSDIRLGLLNKKKTK